MKTFSRTGRQVQYNGTHGNLSVAVLSVAIAAAAINDQFVLGEFDSTIEVVDYRLDHEALGASTTLDLGFAYAGDEADAPTAIAAALSTVAAGSKKMASKAVLATGHTQLIATVKGGVATGEANLVVYYRNRG